MREPLTGKAMLAVRWHESVAHHRGRSRLAQGRIAAQVPALQVPALDEPGLAARRIRVVDVDSDNFAEKVHHLHSLLPLTYAGSLQASEW